MLAKINQAEGAAHDSPAPRAADTASV
jgi:hypothetical protein